MPQTTRRFERPPASDRAAPKSAPHPIQIPLESSARQTRSTPRYFHCAPLFAVPSKAAANVPRAPETAGAAPAQSPAPKAQTKRSAQTTKCSLSPPVAAPARATRSPAEQTPDTEAPKTSPKAHTPNSAARRNQESCASRRNRSEVPREESRRQRLQQRIRRSAPVLDRGKTTAAPKQSTNKAKPKTMSKPTALCSHLFLGAPGRTEGLPPKPRMPTKLRKRSSLAAVTPQRSLHRSCGNPETRRPREIVLSNKAGRRIPRQIDPHAFARCYGDTQDVCAKPAAREISYRR